MPQSLLFQQSYEGYREFELFDGRKLYFQEIIDWSKSGHPFAPVQQLFCTYVMSETVKDYTKGIPLKHVELIKGNKLDNIWSSMPRAGSCDADRMPHRSDEIRVPVVCRRLCCSQFPGQPGHRPDTG